MRIERQAVISLSDSQPELPTNGPLRIQRKEPDRSEFIEIVLARGTDAGDADIDALGRDKKKLLVSSFVFFMSWSSSIVSD